MCKKILSLILIISVISQISGVPVVYAEDKPAVVSLDCTNEAGDYTYFDNHFCVSGVTPGYKNNFKAYPKSNYIECFRIDYDNPKRRDYIYMEKTTDDDCFFDVTCTGRLGYTGNSGKRYDYFLIQGDFYTTQPGTECQLLMLRDSTSSTTANYDHVTSVIMSDGSIKNGNDVYSGYKMRRGEWFNYKLGVNLKTRIVDIYINDVLAQQQTLNADIKNLDLVRFRMRKGTGDMYVDNFSVTGLVVPYQNGVDTLTDVFPDNDAAIMNFLEGKVGMHAYGGLMYKDGAKSVMSPEPLYDKNNKILYAAADGLNSAFGFGLVSSGYGYADTKNDLSVSADGTYTYGSNSGRLSVQPITSAGVLMVPVMEFAKEVLGKYVFFHDSGIVVIGDENEVLDTSGWEYGSFRKVIGNYTMLNDVDFLNGFLSYVRPDSAKLAADFAANVGEYSAHPRILLNQSQFDHLKNLYQTDSKYNSIANRIIAKANSYMQEAPLVYKFDDSMRMYTSGAATQNRFLHWGYAYKLTGDEKYVKRAVEELKALDTFPDFNPLHIIDTGMFCMGLAVAYDWFYDAYTQEERELAGRVCYEECMLPLSKAYYGRISELTSGMGTVRWMSNYNAVVSGGVLNAAVATIECNPEYNLELISNCLKSLEYTLMGLMPDGGWNEAVSYWNYTQEFLSYSMATLDTAFGTSYGIKESQGMEASVEYAMSCIGVGGINNYHDCGHGTAGTQNSYKTFMYLANAYGKYDAYGMRLYDLLERRATAVPEDGLFYNSDIDDYTSVYDKNGTAIVTGGTELFSIRDTYNREKSQLYFSTHFGTTSGYHQHNDCGTFVLDMYGTRFADDLGSDDYNLQNELKYNSWELYRYRAEGHNVLVFEPGNYTAGYEQVTGVFAPIKDYGYNDARGFVYADLSDVYIDVSKLRTGYYVDKDNMSVTMRSEFTTVGNKEVYWFMHTRADVEIDEEANCAYLTRNGHTVCVRFETNGSNAQIMKMDAAPFPTSPQVPEQTVNSNYRKVAIRFDAHGATTLTVNICGAEYSHIPLKTEPIAAWNVSQSAVGEDIVVADCADYDTLSAVTNASLLQKNGLYGDAVSDTCTRAELDDKTDIISVPLTDAGYPYTVARFKANTYSAKVSVTSGGTELMEPIGYQPGCWNSIYVIRRNSDGKILTVLDGEYGDWQSNPASGDDISIAAVPYGEGAYVDVDDLKIYHCAELPVINAPALENVDIDNDFLVNASTVRVGEITSNGAVRVFDSNMYERQLSSEEYLSDGNIVVAENDGIYRYYTATTQPRAQGAGALLSYVDTFDAIGLVRATMQTVDDITGAYGKCAKLTGEFISDTNFYYNFAIPQKGVVSLSADIYPVAECASIRFAKTGHTPISGNVKMSDLNQGEWNNVKLIADLDTGKCDLYINGTYHSTVTSSDITCLRIVFDMNKSVVSSLENLVTYVDNVVMHTSSHEQCVLDMDICNTDGTSISGAAGMQVAEFVSQCHLPNYKYKVDVYSKNSIRSAEQVIQPGDSIYYYFDDVLAGRYIVK